MAFFALWPTRFNPSAFSKVVRASLPDTLGGGSGSQGPGNQTVGILGLGDERALPSSLSFPFNTVAGMMLCIDHLFLLFFQHIWEEVLLTLFYR